MSLIDAKTPSRSTVLPREFLFEKVTKTLLSGSSSRSLLDVSDIVVVQWVSSELLESTYVCTPSFIVLFLLGILIKLTILHLDNSYIDLFADLSP